MGATSVFLVTADNGEKYPDDLSSWTVRVLRNKDQADAFVKLCRITAKLVVRDWRATLKRNRLTLLTFHQHRRIVSKMRRLDPELVKERGQNIDSFKMVRYGWEEVPFGAFSPTKLARSKRR